MNHKISIVKFQPQDWALCSSLLIMSVDGHQFRVDLLSGGAVWFDDDWRDHYDIGPWSLDGIPDQFKHLTKDLTDVVNAQIPWGCCGGCI